MAKYAKGKHAVLIDDRSGFKIKYKNARTEWTGFRVYKGDWEPKQPQLDPQNYISGSEANILYKPRPDQDSVPTTVFLGSLYGKWSGQCAANLGRITVQQSADAPSGFQMTSALNFWYSNSNCLTSYKSGCSNKCTSDNSCDRRCGWI